MKSARFAARVAAWLAFTLAGLGIVSTQAGAAVAPEPTVKAVYIYRFLDYVTWPPERFRTPDDPILIGVIENDEVAQELAAIARERLAQGRRLRLVLVRDERDLPVHVLYVSDITRARARLLLERAREQPTLIVANAPGALDAGASINLVRTVDRVQFEVAADAAARSGLTISSRLLAVAVRVRKSDTGATVLALGDGATAMGVAHAVNVVRYHAGRSDAVAHSRKGRAPLPRT